MFLNDLPTKDFELSIANAHKIKEKIHNNMPKPVNSLRGIFDKDNTIFPSISIPTDELFSKEVDQLVRKLNHRWENYIENKRLRFALKYDFNRIKEAIFEANIQHGISKLLNELNQLSLQKSMMETFDVDTESEKNLNETIESLKSHYRDRETVPSYINIDYLFYNPEEVKKSIRELNSRILKLEEEVTVLNASKTVNFTLFEITAEQIGL